MLVCHCKAVPERVVRAAIDAGADDVLSVALACGAGTDCGGCVPTIVALLDRRLVQEHRVAGDRVQQLGVAAGPRRLGGLGSGHAG